MARRDEALEALAALLIAPAAIAWLAPQVLNTATDWLINHHVLVPTDHASLTIPGTRAGLDPTRIKVAIALTFALAAALIARTTRKAATP